MKISEQLAQDDPTDSLTQSCLILFHYKVGNIHFENEDIAKSEASFVKGVAVLDQTIANGKNIEQHQSIRRSLQAGIAKCKSAQEMDEPDEE